MRALLAAARRSRSLLAAGRRHESALAVQPSLVDGSPASPYLAYSRPQAEPFNDSLIFESFPETKAPPMLPARLESPCSPLTRRALSSGSNLSLAVPPLVGRSARRG